MDAQHSTDTDKTRFTDRLWSLVTSPYAWGAVATVGFYKGLPHLPVYREEAERYFCAHPVEYVQTALFFVGLFILVRKLLGLRSQRAATRACILQAATSGTPALPAGVSADATSQLAGAIDGWGSKLLPSQRRTWMAERLAEVRQYLQLRPSADALESQLKELDQRAADDLHDSFSLLQTINWAIPIMGFLGTVLGITMAIFNLDVNHLDSSLSEVTFNLAVAFDTTAVALCHSIVLVFLYLFVKRTEERTLAQIASFCRRQMLPLMPNEAHAPSPLIEAEAAAARQLVERTGQLIESQTSLWSESIENLRSRWSGMLASQQQSLSQALQTGTSATLDQHAELLKQLRCEFLRALDQVSQNRAQADAQLRAQEAALVARWEAGTTQLATLFAAAEQAADHRTSRMLTEMSAQFDGWKSELRAATGSLTAHTERLVEQEARVGELLERGDDVISLESKLNENLQALRAAETFEQTMHSLSAAVHLLTAHSRQRAA